MSVTLFPSQKVSGPLAETVVAVVAYLIVFVMADVDLQPLAPVTVTLNDPVVSTVIDEEVEPLFQTIFDDALEVKVT